MNASGRGLIMMGAASEMDKSQVMVNRKKE